MQLPLLPELVLPPETTIKPSAARRVHCNRSLRLDGIEWVGFDMDYTLAIYDQEQMDRLSIEATARKLVERGYPERLLRMRYRTDFPIRGLLIDRKLGNVLKMDRYKYVKMAYHGMRELSLEERRRIYHARRLRPATKRYHWVDTLYALSEVAVFAAAIEALEAEDARVDYGRLFSDVRECIDLSHQDGSILDRVLADLPRLVPPDPELGPTLHRLRSSGKKLFLLTNSHAPYTERMMTHLLGGSLADYPSWRNYFELIITAACKPTFFTKREPFEEILDGERRPAGPLSRGKIYAGGNIVDLERSLGAVGDRILYVGDHIYGDVLRAKKETAWRTVMIIQEMDAEFRALEACEASIHRMDQLDGARDALHDRLREQLS
ncbi:MAG: HAD-IG family 5'-nucleotidase, partial [Myxococcales bacterium]|nr:HAD-IG family 5'-nucleotidase [Myxococcales bacterium]